jgi:hypothetical protein
MLSAIFGQSFRKETNNILRAKVVKNQLQRKYSKGFPLRKIGVL